MAFVVDIAGEVWWLKRVSPPYRDTFLSDTQTMRPQSNGQNTSSRHSLHQKGSIEFHLALLAAVVSRGPQLLVTVDILRKIRLPGASQDPGDLPKSK
jgi:hypothetical protein